MDCNGHSDHRYFVADVVLVPTEGKVVVCALCTACGTPQFHEHKVSAPNVKLDSLNSQRKNKE